MKIKSFLCCIAAAALALVGCEPAPNTGYEGTNYIYLTTEGNTTIFEADETPLVVDVTLTTALETDLELKFSVSDKAGIVKLVDNPVIIKAGEKHGQVKVVSNRVGKLQETTTYLLGLDVDSVLPTGVRLSDNFSFTVTPVASDVLTEAQKAVIEAYKAKTGVDLSKYIGFVDVTTVYVGTNLDTGEPLAPETINGKTIIGLNEKSTADAPILNMTANPMGIQDKMYKALRAATIENEVWLTKPEDGGIADFGTLMNAIKWNKDSRETFEMSLDSITLDASKNVTFLGKGKNQYDEEITIVPFCYKFSAYERELAAIADGSLVKSSDWYSEATAKPEYHVNNDGILEDGYMGGNWIAPTATISAEKLEFTFCIYPNSLCSDYVRVTATYLPAK